MEHKKVIWKYEIPITDHFNLNIPPEARILTVDVQDGTPYVWVEQDPEAMSAIRYFRIYGTGHTHRENEAINYIGTFQMKGGALIWHLYELVRKGAK